MKSPFFQHVLYITKNIELLNLARAVCQRIGATEHYHFETVSEATKFILQKRGLIQFVVEDVVIIDEFRILPFCFKDSINDFRLLPPCFAFVSLDSGTELSDITKTLYLDYLPKPINETIFEKRLRKIYSYSMRYAQIGIIDDVVQRQIDKDDIRSAYQTLMPAFIANKKYFSYFKLYIKILIEKGEFELAKKAVFKILKKEPENFFATSIMMKLKLFSQDEEKLALDSKEVV